MPLIPRIAVQRGAVVCLHCRKKLVDDIQGGDYRLQFTCPRCHKVTTLEASGPTSAPIPAQEEKCMVQG